MQPNFAKANSGAILLNTEFTPGLQHVHERIEAPSPVSLPLPLPPPLPPISSDAAIRTQNHLILILYPNWRYVANTHGGRTGMITTRVQNSHANTTIATINKSRKT